MRPATRPRPWSSILYGDYAWVVGWISGYIFNLIPFFLDYKFDPDNAGSWDPVPFPGMTVVQSLFGDNFSFYGGLVFDELRSIQGFTSNGAQVTDQTTQDLADLDAINAPSGNGWTMAGGFSFLLQQGDKISVQRFRGIEIDTQTAKLAPADAPTAANPTPVDTAFNALVLAPWRQVDFIYGTTDKGGNGVHLSDLAQFLSDNLKSLCRDTSGNSNDLTFTPMRTIPAKKGQAASTWHLVFARNALEVPLWKKDGLVLRFVATRPGTGGAPDTDLGHFWFDYTGAVFPGEYTTSGLATSGRGLFVHYGKDLYANAGILGADPSGGSGRGYRDPGGLFAYDMPTNVAHELGHTLYLRHQFTADSYDRAGLLDHDYDDLCHMSYYTGFVDTGSGPAPSADQSGVRSGQGRDSGRAEPCARCLLKLRGWGLDQSDFPGNVPSSSPAPATTSGSHSGAGLDDASDETDDDPDADAAALADAEAPEVAS